MPKVRKKLKERRINHVAKENTRLKGAELLSSFYDEDRPRSESGSFSSNPMVSICNVLRTPSPDLLSVSVQLIEDGHKRDASLQTTPKSNRNISDRFSSRSRGSFFSHSKNRFSPLCFSHERGKPYSGDNDSPPVNEDIVDFEAKEKDEIICATPKIRYDSINISKRDSNLEIVNTKKDAVVIKSDELVCFTRTKSQNEVKHLQGIININPYMDYKQYHIKSQKDNVNEQSFFTRDLLESKPASTPIHAVNERSVPRLPFNDISNSNSITNKTRNLRDSMLRRSALTPVIIEEPLPKEGNIDNEVEVQRKITEFLSKTAPVGDIGTNMAKITRVLNKVNQNPNTYKTLGDDSSSRDDTLGGFRKVMRQMHKYGTVTAKWTMSLFSVCMRLGFSIRPIQTLSQYFLSDFQKIAETPCTLCVDPESVKSCTCTKYQEEISKLKIKIEELGVSIGDLRNQLLENIKNNRKVETLNATLEELTKEVENLKSLKDEMDNLRNRFNTLNHSSFPQTPMSVTRVAPVAAPPPPPPPPPPPLLPQANKINILKKSSMQTKAQNETPRPVISLDDILKVKLKKTTERSVMARRSTGSQPEITKDMLQQVKLRKPCRSMTPSRLPDLSPEGSTSPHSSLRRLLKDDGSFKIKRLRRVGGYSFNDMKKRDKLSRERQ